MGKLIYGMGGLSLDGYVADATGDFNWGHPGLDLHAHAAAELRKLGTDIYGRKMYEMMVYWETADQSEMPPAIVEFAEAWQAADKLVVSGSLAEVTSKRTRLVPRLGPDDVRKLKAESAKPISVAGPTLASGFLNEGLVDEVTAYCMPVIVGDGLPMFKDVTRLIRLEQIEELPLSGGFIFRRYAVRN